MGAREVGYPGGVPRWGVQVGCPGGVSRWCAQVDSMCKS